MSEQARATSADGLELRVHAWVPAEPRALLLVVHGLGEHGGRYRILGESFAARGYGVFAVDLRGHGESPGPRVHVDRFEDYYHDVDALVDCGRKRFPELPVVLLGHSMGGLITLGYTIRAPEGIAAAVVSSPALAAHPSLVPSLPLRLVAKVLQRVAPRTLFPSGIDPAGISRDPEVVAAYQADPLVSGKVSARWYAEVTAAQARIRAAAPSFLRPLLLMQSGADRLVDPEATKEWAQRAPDRVDFVLWDGLYHEMLNEPEKPEVFSKIESWLGSTLASA